MSIAMTERAVAAEPDSRLADDIDRLGFAGPVPLLSPDQCAALLEHVGLPDMPAPLDWWKGRAATDRTIYEVATLPRLIGLLRPLLGEDIVLWGASIIRRRAGTLHPWHTDVESAGSDGGVISAWVGLCNASERSGLLFATGSHRFGRSVQEALAELGEDRTTISDERMAEIARTMDPAARIAQLEARDGEVVLFDGRAWHSGRNDGAHGTRIALLLQYAAADTPIPMPAASGHVWPFTFAASPRVPTILVSGTGSRSANRLVPPPPPPNPKGLPMITTLAQSVALPLAEDPVKRWRAYHQFRGPTRTLAEMSCHLSVLSSGHHPHPPHIHREEELLIVLDGEVEIELAEAPDSTASRRHALKPGMFSYYPATQHHTIHNVGADPATYLMFKWHAGMAGSEAPLPASIFQYDVAAVSPNPKPMATKLLFQQATHCLGKLHAHLTTLQPGGGYEPHADAYDVAIVLLSGEVETVGRRVTPLGIIYYSAGELHGMRNVGNGPATYLVFEFHSPAAVASRRQDDELRLKRRAEQEAKKAARQTKQAERQAQQAQRAERLARRAERERRKLEKQRRKRGLRGFVRKIVKAVRKLFR